MSEQWAPHQRETWPWRIGVLKRDVEYARFTGRWKDGNPIMDEKTLPARTRVKIVMVSRFGDVGITDDLDSDYGYGARVSRDDLEPVI